jgi:hypothetical protein
MDETAYREMLHLAKQPESRCATSGRSLHALRKVGERLSIDRIDPNKGYTEGNMQLLALSLNKAKGNSSTVPARAVTALLKRLSFTVDDKLSDFPGATETV